MKILLLIGFILLVVSKFLDCLTTSWRMKSAAQERNVMVRRLMQRWGVRRIIWGIFAVSVLFVLVITFVVYFIYDALFFDVIYLILAIFISIVQFAVAINNFTGRPNFITKAVLKVGQKFYR